MTGGMWYRYHQFWYQVPATGRLVPLYCNNYCPEGRISNDRRSLHLIAGGLGPVSPPVRPGQIPVGGPGAKPHVFCNVSLLKTSYNEKRARFFNLKGNYKENTSCFHMKEL